MKRKRNNSTTPGPTHRHAAILLAITVLGLLLAGCRREQVVADIYTCPMHPTVVAQKPGVCPVCGMELVRKTRAGEEMKITEDLKILLASPAEAVISNIATLRVTYRSAVAPIKVSGLVTYDPLGIHTVPVRTAGRLEEMYVTSPLQRVHQGDRVAKLYSPELAEASRELIFLETHDAANHAMIQSARQRLALLGLTGQQIDDMVRRKETTGTYMIYSPYSGTVPAEDNLPREGDYVSAGQALFSLADTDDLRLELELPGTYAPHVHAGDTVILDLDAEGHVFTRVDLVQPFFADGEDLLTVRIKLNHTRKLEVGKIISSTLALRGDDAYWIPREAVSDLGLHAVVFVLEQGVFKPREVQTGVVAGDWLQIRSGLTSQDEIATQAGYLVDSESFIQTAF